jgi:hypothetical protein
MKEKDNSKNLAMIPLRDERHRSLLSYAEIYDGSALILDPKKCCITPDLNCAKQLRKELNQAGYTIILPVENRHTPRIDAIMKPWYKILASTFKQNHRQNTYWLWELPTASGGYIPCKKPIDNP